MRGERKISKLIAEFTGCAATRGDEYMMTIDDGQFLISWTDGEIAGLNKTWKYRLMEDYGFNLTKENVFIMSILHELGHAMTVGNFSEEDWNLEFCLKEQIGEEVIAAEEDDDYDEWFYQNQRYFLMPTEKAATDWAIEQYRTQPFIRAWQHRLNCAVKHYEKVSGRKVFEAF